MMSYKLWTQRVAKKKGTCGCINFVLKKLENFTDRTCFHAGVIAFIIFFRKRKNLGHWNSRSL